MSHSSYNFRINKIFQLTPGVFLDDVLVEGEHALHLVADLEEENTFDLVVHFAVLDSEDFVDVGEVFMNFTVGHAWGDELFDDVVDELLDGVSVERDFDGVVSKTVLTDLVEVVVVHHVGDHGVLGSEIGKMVDVSGKEFWNVVTNDDGARLGHTRSDWLAEVEDLKSLQVPVRVKYNF